MLVTSQNKMFEVYRRCFVINQSIDQLIQQSLINSVGLVEWKKINWQLF